MNIDITNYVVTVLIVIIFSNLLRFTPFILFDYIKETPKWLDYLSKVIPATVIAVLVVYCLKGVSFVQKPYGLAEIISIAFVVLTYLWKKNSLVSIILGTILYMVLIRTVFVPVV